MLIDWFTVIAQAVNFVILVWLMKHFLYKPVLHAIDAREKLIATKLADAEKKEQDSQKEKAEFTKKNQDFDKQRADLLKKATDEAQSQGKHILDETKKAAAASSLKQQETIKADEQKLHQEIISRTQQEVLSISLKLLTDLADTGLEKSIIDNFVKRLLNLKNKENEVQREKLKSAFNSANGAFVIRSASELPTDLKASILASLKDVFGFNKEGKDDPLAKIQFQTSKDLIGGVELTVNGEKIAWSISDYLKSLGQGVVDASPR